MDPFWSGEQFWYEQVWSWLTWALCLGANTKSGGGGPSRDSEMRTQSRGSPLANSVSSSFRPTCRHYGTQIKHAEAALCVLERTASDLGQDIAKHISTNRAEEDSCDTAAGACEVHIIEAGSSQSWACARKELATH